MKRIIILFDGTWDTPSDKTNVLRFHQALAPRDAQGVEQRASYYRGVGTSWHGRILGGAFGYGLSEILREAFRWLAANHQSGDELYVFGFSRGAYTARSFVGLVRKCGVLNTADPALVAEAYDLYRRRSDTADSPDAVAFRQSRSHETRVKFIGVWDTVGSLGIPVTGLKLPFFRDYYQFHDTELSKIVDYAFHALALDEYRADFAPTLWSATKPENIAVEQRWFIGAHTDVGGGSGSREEGLYVIALRWMQDKAAATGLALTKVYAVEPAFAQAPINDSFGSFMHGIYKLLKRGERYIRTVGATIYERIDDTVWARWSETAPPQYRPPPLAKVAPQTTDLCDAPKPG